MAWSAVQYRKFESERNRPSRDLLAQIPNGRVITAADLGCGPGNSTELLQRCFPDARILGIDSSPDMIVAARERLPDVTFEITDIVQWSEDGPFDVLFANASLQWVPDHAVLLPALLAKLAPGGSLAVQMPDNADEPSHRLMREIAEVGDWSEKLCDAPRAMDNRHSADWYFQLLRENGATVDLWRTTYYHPLAGGVSAIVEWFKATGLRPYLQPLDGDEQRAFLERYEARLADEYPLLLDGTVLLPFPRLFFIATR